MWVCVDVHVCVCAYVRNVNAYVRSAVCVCAFIRICVYAYTRICVQFTLLVCRDEDQHEDEDEDEGEDIDEEVHHVQDSDSEEELSIGYAFTHTARGAIVHELVFAGQPFWGTFVGESREHGRVVNRRNNQLVLRFIAALANPPFPAVIAELIATFAHYHY
jgi:hypothetical protein